MLSSPSLRLLLVFSLLVITAMPLAAQDPLGSDEEGALSLMIHTSLATGMASAMQGGLNDVVRDINTGGTHIAYPGLGMSFLPHTGGVQFGYGFPASPLGVYIDGGWTLFRTRPTHGVMGILLAGTVAIGMEGEIWHPWKPVTLFGRAGINGSSIGGEEAVGATHIIIRNGGRLGAEGEVGGRYTWGMRHFAVELSGCYRSLNIIGKGYKAAWFDAEDRVTRRGVNDGARPGDPADSDRTIDLLALRIGVRLIF